MENLAIPWLHYAILATTTVSLFFAFLLFWILRQGSAAPETGWLAGLTATYGVVGLFSLHFLDMHTLAEFRWNQFYRLSFSHLGFLLVLGFFESYFRTWETYAFKAMAVLVSLPLLYMATGRDLETAVELSRYRLSWGETITVAKTVNHPLVGLRNGLVLLMFLVALGRCLWQVAHRREVKRHLLLAVAVLVPILLSLKTIALMETYKVPLSQFGIIGFGLVMLVPILNGVTSSRRLSREIASHEAQLRFMASQVPGALYSLQVEPDGTHRFLFLSERVMDVLGFPADHPQPLQAFMQGLSPEDLACYCDSEAEAMRTLQPWNFTSKFTRPDGEVIWFQGFSHMSRNAQGCQSNGVLMDITERVRQEHELKRLLKEAALRSDELEGLLFTMGHDLRSPLVNIDGFSYEALLLLENKTGWNEEARQECLAHLQRLRDESLRMNELIDTLLMLGRRSRDYLEISMVDTGAVLCELASLLPFAANRLRVEIAPELPFCRADAQQLRLVLTKVLENCIDYRKPAEDGVVRISAHREGQRVCLEISDTGIGFAEQYGDIVLQAFHQLNPSKEHQGVGLTIARLALLRMDGSIRARSAPGLGTTVVVELPAG